MLTTSETDRLNALISGPRADGHIPGLPLDLPRVRQIVTAMVEEVMRTDEFETGHAHIDDHMTEAMDLLDMAEESLCHADKAIAALPDPDHEDVGERQSLVPEMRVL